MSTRNTRKARWFHQGWRETQPGKYPLSRADPFQEQNPDGIKNDNAGKKQRQVPAREFRNVPGNVQLFSLASLFSRLPYQYCFISKNYNVYVFDRS